MTIYAEPIVGRAGLGNGLFPWARAEVFARRCSTQVLAPTWAGWRIGPYLRREPDKRRYAAFFDAPHHVRGPARLFAKAAGVRIGEEETLRPALSRRRPVIVRFEGLRDLFAPLAGQRAYVAGKLWQMTRTDLRPMRPLRPFLAMHIRRGDLTRQGFTSEELRSVLQYTDISWFLGMARAVRNQPVLRDMPIVVFTDGSRSEVDALTAEDGIVVQEPRAAITDLLHLSQATLLFASGYSTFSMWASFIGLMPTVYAPGKLLQKVHASPDSEGACEIELAANAPIPRQIADRVLAMQSGESARRMDSAACVERL